jgi:hypothetical protein
LWIELGILRIELEEKFFDGDKTFGLDGKDGFHFKNFFCKLLQKVMSLALDFFPLKTMLSPGILFMKNVQRNHVEGESWIIFFIKKIKNR